MAATRRLPNPWRHPRTGGYYLRRHFPTHLQPLLGQEARRSLGTSDLPEARRRYPAMAAKVQQEIDKAQAEYDARQELDRQAAETDMQVDAEAVFMASLTASQRALYYRTSWARAHGEAALVAPQEAVDAYLLPQRSVHGPAVAAPEASVQRPEESGHSGGHRSGQISFTNLVDAWAAERRPDPRSVAAWRMKVAAFGRWLGHDDAERVTKADVRRYRDWLLAEGRAPKTVADALTQLRVLYSVAVENDRLPDNPAAAVKSKAKADALEKVRPYTHGEAAKVLEVARGKPETNTLRWLPILLAWTGARLEELAGLRARDVREDNGAGYYLDLVHHEARPLKTASSQRRIPLAYAVEASGFIEYLEGRRKVASPDGLLFADLTPDTNGRLGPNLSKRLASLVRSEAGITDPRLQPAHGFRHRFADLLREQRGIDQHLRDQLMGHTSPGLGARYGAGFSLAALRKAVEAIEAIEDI